MLGTAGIGERQRLVGVEPPALERRLDRPAQGGAQGAERRRVHQPGSGPWSSRNLRQSAGRFSWKLAMPSAGSGP